MAGNTQKRKLGDTIILSGELSRASADGGVYPEDADWTGAVGKINIVSKATRAAPSEIVVDHDTVTLTPPDGDTLARYRYVGLPSAIDEEGKYLYEIEVTFTDNTVLTWPNDKTEFVLEMEPELA